MTNMAAYLATTLPTCQLPVFASIGDLLVPCIPGLYSNRSHPRIEANTELLAWQRVQILAGLAVMPGHPRPLGRMCRSCASPMADSGSRIGGRK